MIDPGHPRLSIVRQCELASISRSSFYREPTAENEATLRLMRLIDEQFLETPWYGSAADGTASAAQRLVCRAPSCPSADDQDGVGADLPAPQDQRTTSAASEVAVSTSPPEYRLVRRRDLHPDAPRRPVSGRSRWADDTSASAAIDEANLWVAASRGNRASSAASCQGSISNRANVESTLSGVSFLSSPMIANRKKLNSDPAAATEAEPVMSNCQIALFCRTRISSVY